MSKSSKDRSSTEPRNAVLVTGALGGIGQAMCSEFQAAGYFVIATDRQDGECACDAFLRVDIQELCSSTESRDKLFEEVASIVESNEVRLHSLINNAAIQILNRTDDVTMDDWRTTLDTNLVAPFMLIQRFLPLLEASSGGVVNVASVHAVATKPEFVCYATSKSALVGLTRAMAVDLGPRLRLNAISPAATATPMLLAGFEGRPEALKELANMHPLERIAEPAEIAQTAVFLCSDNAKFITGSCWHVDGGIGARLHDPI